MKDLKDTIFILKRKIKLHLELGNKNMVAILRMRLKSFEELENELLK